MILKSITALFYLPIFADASMAAADFNAQISNIGAVSGATAEHLGQLKQLASDLESDRRFRISTTGAASVIEMLVRNGLQAADILNGAAEATALLALDNTANADYSTAAKIVTNVMATFSIEAENMISAVDGITSVTSNSKFGIADYQLFLDGFGNNAVAFGIKFVDFNTIAAAVAPLFLNGAIAAKEIDAFLMSFCNVFDTSRLTSSYGLRG